jgi:hypothetical protein
MMWPSVEVARLATRIDFEMAAAHTERSAVSKHKDVRTDSGAAVPIKIRCGIFLGRVLGRGRLPLAKFDIEAGEAVRKGGGRGVIPPKFGKGLARILAALDSGPIWKSAAAGASSFVRLHPNH